MHKVREPFVLGKLPAAHLARLLTRFSRQDPRVVVGPRVGEDAAVLDMGDRYLVAKSDPITFATDAIGWYAVHVNANDVACTGAAPRWFLCTLLLPEGRADAALVDEIFAQILQACDEIGATLVGGHTEITYGLDRPIVVGGMLGEVDPQHLVTTGGARPGDVVLLTQRMAVEATAIIAREKRDELSQRDGFTASFLDRCADFIYQPGISIVPAAQVATATAAVHAMHDPTEGGLATGLWELASAADVGLEIDAGAVPIYPETRLLCEIYGLDPWGVIASGSLLLTVDRADADRVCDALSGAGVEATVIGHVVSQEEGVTLRVEDGDQGLEQSGAGAARGTVALPTFARDEIARLFE
jgi:hydrogenase expression/formation protein HypE